MSVLLVVIVIGASSVIMAKGAAFLSIGELDMGKTVSEGGSAYYAADACLNEALLRIKRDSAFFASDLELTINGNSCIMNVTGNEYSKNVVVSGSTSGYQKDIQASVNIVNGNVILGAIQ